MDTLTPDRRSRLMAKIRGKDTLPEILVRKRLFACGWRCRVCDKRFRGKPDMVVPRAKTIIDVRGCFWHRHGCENATMPKSHVRFWMEKWSKNVRRDIRNEKAWRDAGWNLIVVWQCALEGVKAERTLARLCAKVEAWASECASGGTRRVPHRMELPPARRRRRAAAF